MICGKRIYSSRTEAAMSVRGFNKDRRHRKGTYRISKQKNIKETYWCHECEGWHVSSGGRKSKRKSMRQAPNNVEINYNARVVRFNRAKKSVVTIRNFRNKF